MATATAERAITPRELQALQQGRYVKRPVDVPLTRFGTRAIVGTQLFTQGMARSPHYRGVDPLQALREYNANLLARVAVQQRSVKVIKDAIPAFDISPETVDYLFKTAIPKAIAKEQYDAQRRAKRKGKFLFGLRVGDIGQVLAGVFTLGLSEIKIDGERLGQRLRLEPTFSGLSTGGIVVTGAKSRTEQKQFQLAFQTGTAVATVGAATAGTKASLSGAANKLVTNPYGVPQFAPAGGIVPASGGWIQTTGLSALTGQTGSYIQRTFGNIGTGVTRILTGDVIGGVQQIISPPRPAPTVPHVGPSAGQPLTVYAQTGGGGSGLGVWPGSSNTGTAPNSTMVVIGFVIVGLFGLLLWKGIRHAK